MTISPLHADLYRALTGTDCTCERDRIEDDDRRPRILRIPDPDCVEHGDHTINDAWKGIPDDTH